MEESTSTWDYLYSYIDKMPDWGVFVLFIIFLIVVVFTMKEISHWFFSHNKRNALLREQNELLKKMTTDINIITTRLVGSGLKRESEEESESSEKEKNDGESSEGGAGQEGD